MGRKLFLVLALVGHSACGGDIGCVDAARKLSYRNYVQVSGMPHRPGRHIIEWHYEGYRLAPGVARFLEETKQVLSKTPREEKYTIEALVDNIQLGGVSMKLTCVDAVRMGNPPSRPPQD